MSTNRRYIPRLPIIATRVVQKRALGAPASRATSRLDRIDTIWLALGACAAVYVALIERQPMAVPYLAFLGLLGYGGAAALLRGDGQDEAKRGFVHAFCSGVFAIALSRTFAVFFDDAMHNRSDANSFFEAATEILRDTDIYQLTSVINGWGAVWVWHQFYSLTDVLWPVPTPLVGIGLNALTIALSVAALVRIVAMMVPNDLGVCRRARNYGSLCFVFWIFASFHLRDAFTVLLTVTTIGFCVWFFRRVSAVRMVGLFCALAALAAALGSVRNESSSIVIVAGVACCAAVAFRNVVLAVSGVLAATAFVLSTRQFILPQITGTTEMVVFYREAYQFDVGAQSLADRFILGRAPPLRAVLGFAYLHAFPIPIWNGFTLGSAYFWFKSLQVVHMGFILPGAIAGALVMWRKGGPQRSQVVFLTALYVAICVAVALSSLETRHSAQVLPCLILLAACAIPGENSSRLRKVYFLGLAGIHVAWIVLKQF